MLPQLQGLGEGLFEKTAISGVAFISTQWAEFCKPVYPFTCTTSKTLLILTQQTSHSSISLNFNTGNILPFHPIKYKYIRKARRWFFLNMLFIATHHDAHIRCKNCTLILQRPRNTKLIDALSILTDKWDLPLHLSIYATCHTYIGWHLLESHIPALVKMKNRPRPSMVLSLCKFRLPSSVINKSSSLLSWKHEPRLSQHSHPSSGLQKPQANCGGLLSHLPSPWSSPL